MTRQALVQWLRDRYAAIRPRLTARRIGGTVAVAMMVGTAGIAIEAAIRAHLGPAEARLPTALYARPVPWGAEGEAAESPTPIALLTASALESRRPVTLDDVPESLVQAVLAIEDQRFYQHEGFDVRRIGGAFVANVKAGGIAQGGSTITQQLAKNLFLSADRTPLRKLREVAFATALELRHDKATILEAYLNEIYLGQENGRAIHGVGAAARAWFGKDVSRLSLPESALLAGMIHAPNRHTPTRHPDAARARRNLVLQLMAEQGRITASSARKAQGSRISTRNASPAIAVDARHFRDAAVDAMPRSLPKRGAAVYTTLDARLQQAAQRAVRRGLARLPQRGTEAALVAIDPRTGEVLAMIGGRDYSSSQFNRATEAKRQPGSAFKPIVALAALGRSEGDAPAFTLASVVDDAPLSLKTSRGMWQPSNYDGEFRGPVTVRQALEESLNVPFVRIGMAVGPSRIAATAKRLGITSPMPAVPSLALGSAEVSLLELVRAYGVLANGGSLARTQMVLANATTDAASSAPDVTSVVDPATAWLVTSALQGVVDHGTGAGLQERIGYSGMAGKTGTSSDWRDAWFVAYSPTLVVGVWVGHDDGRSLRATGSAAALPIVADFLAEALEQGEAGEFEVPAGITEGRAGLAPGEWSDGCGTTEYFLEGTEPAHQDCYEIEFPDMGELNEIGSALQRRAERLFEALIARGIEQRRGRR
ncbi:MAG: PBP1A family penicillin-binding protein [Gemmatimonadales bacterium]|nr:PBP1A family penicillin-binding protein [Gemmatimonadales bacterium]